MTYGARQDYQSDDSARTYLERPVYSGWLGKMRNRTEQGAIAGLVDLMEQGSVVLDLPCGNGRWFDALARKASSIIGRDISEGMVRFAATRQPGIPVEVALGDAEAIALGENAVDYVFSFALMKHLPVDVQARVLSEFARVSRKGVICSFALLRPISKLWWQWKNPPESWPLSTADLDRIAALAGLRVEKVVKVSQPIIGLEYFAVLRPVR
jgi:SAM-dependent methyltransferase